VAESQDVRGEPFDKLGTGLPNHERPFDRLRANELNFVFAMPRCGGGSQNLPPRLLIMRLFNN